MVALSMYVDNPTMMGPSVELEEVVEDDVLVTVLVAVEGTVGDTGLTGMLPVPEVAPGLGGLKEP
jgi:hypothetical protein